jgi:hypothetical protein
MLVTLAVTVGLVAFEICALLIWAPNLPPPNMAATGRFDVLVVLLPGLLFLCIMLFAMIQAICPVKGEHGGIFLGLYITFFLCIIGLFVVALNCFRTLD